MQVGSYVVCVDDSNWDVLAFVVMTGLPEKGKVYCVRRVIPDFTKISDEEGIALDGIFGDWGTFNTYHKTQVFEEYHFRKSRFREIEKPLLVEDVLEEEEELCEV